MYPTGGLRRAYLQTLWIFFMLRMSIATDTNSVFCTEDLLSLIGPFQMVSQGTQYKQYLRRCVRKPAGTTNTGSEESFFRIFRIKTN